MNLKTKAELMISLSGLETVQGQQYETPCYCHSLTFHCAAETQLCIFSKW